MISRIVSGMIAIGYVIVAFLADGVGLALRSGMFLILPLACIWFSEAMGSFTGVMRGQAITSTTPGCLVAFGGWILLILPVILGLIHVLSEGR